MIDLNEMAALSQRGVQKVEALTGIEKDLLKNFCSVATEALMQMAVQRHAPVDEIVVNAFKNGIALGLELSIVNGEVKGR